MANYRRGVEPTKKTHKAKYKRNGTVCQPFVPSRPFIVRATEEYLSRGGQIVKLEHVIGEPRDICRQFNGIYGNALSQHRLRHMFHYC